MRTPRHLLPALGASFALTLGGSGEKLVFQPEPGSSVTKSFTIAGDYSLEDFSLTLNGEDMSSNLPEIDMDLKAESKIEVTDAYKAVAGGRPTELLRTFDSLGGSMHMSFSVAPAEIPDMESTSPLEGKTVLFKWNPEKSEYERSFKGEDKEAKGDAALLEHLAEDMDLRIFLPGSEKAENDTWKVPLGDLEGIVMPGGDLALRPGGMPDNDEGMKMFEEIFGDFGKEFKDLLEGECNCTFKGVHEDQGVRLGEIAIDLDVNTTLDLSGPLEKAIRAAIEQTGQGDQVQFTLDTADLNLDFEGSGTLLWDLKAGRVHSFQLSGDATIGIDFGIKVEAQGGSENVEATLQLSGSMREEVATKE